VIRPFLLDTCAAMYLVASEPMTKDAYAAMDSAVDARLPLWVSPITMWEVGLLSRKGRFDSALPPHLWFDRLRRAPGIRVCELSADVLLESSFLPGKLNKDPADRIIAATAREYGYTVMTRDRGLLDYGQQGYLSVIEC
jgi:PIN domain nuclease of toxin-antitoxin system